MKVRNTANTPNPEWLLGGNPGAIEAQEAAGQIRLVNSDQLPAKGNYYSKINVKDQYAKMGIKVVGPSHGDDLFLDIELPEGWKKEATSHSMWNNLLDDKGRIRATFFYKAAFYDRDAFINFQTRYTASHEYLEGERRDGCPPKKAVVKDGEDIILESEPYYGDPFKDQPYEDAKQWLKKKFPKHEDINEYWD